MSHDRRKIMSVARWEFMRYFKWRQELIGLLIMAAILGAFYGGNLLMDRYKGSQSFEVAVIGMEQLGMQPGEYGRLRLEAANATEQDTLLAEIATETLDGLLLIDTPEQARLQIARDGGWHEELEALINTRAREHALAEAGVTAAEFEHWSRPMTLAVERRQSGAVVREESGSRMFALIMLGVMLFAVFNSFAYYFASITAEKQQRVSEQILSAISAQTWIDGKILGLTTLGCKALIKPLLWGFVGLAAYTMSTGNMPDLEGLMPPVGTAVLISSFALLGLLFWNCVLAAIAATIDDPNSSSRSALMMLPMVPVVLVYLGLDVAGNPFMVFMSWFPPTAWAAMPARHVMEGVAAWELMGALILLLFAVGWVRRAAGKIFATGMLMYGKEPGLGTLWRTLKEG